MVQLFRWKQTVKNNCPGYLLLSRLGHLDYVKITIYSPEASVWLPVSWAVHKRPGNRSKVRSETVASAPPSRCDVKLLTSCYLAFLFPFDDTGGCNKGALPLRHISGHCPPFEGRERGRVLETVSHCSLGWPGMHYVKQTDLKLITIL